MGGDSFCNLTKWHNYQYIIEGFNLIVYSRGSFDIKNTVGAKIKIVDAPLLEISSTLIREKIKRGAPLDYWLPKSVADEIINNNYYKLPANKPRNQ